MIPIDKADMPSQYHRITKKRQIKVSTKILRFIVRYILPTIVLSSMIAYTYLYLNSSDIPTFDDKDKLLFVVCVIGLGIIAIIISNAWFTLISKTEDKDENIK